jgi:putative redox protein
MKNLFEEDITGSTSEESPLTKITWRNGMFIMDEPPALGGTDAGPDPFTLLLASLTGCTLSTLKMYIARKGWSIPDIKVTSNIHQQAEIGKEDSLVTTIHRTLTFPDNISEEQRLRLQEIAEKCPIAKLLKNKVLINTSLAPVASS